MTRWSPIVARDRCKNGKLEHSGLCMDISNYWGDWEQQCKQTDASKAESKPAVVSGKPDEIERHGNEVWGVWYEGVAGKCGYNSETGSGTTTSGLRWGDITKKECDGEKRKYSARCWGASTSDWVGECAALPASSSERNEHNVSGAPGRDNIKRSGNEVWGEWFRHDQQCVTQSNGSGSASKSELKRRTSSRRCEGGTSYDSSLGEAHPDAGKKLILGSTKAESNEASTFTLKSVKYINPGKDNQTFLYQTRDGLNVEALNTDDSLKVNGNPVPPSYQFTFERIGDHCTASDGSLDKGDLFYGDKVQLKSVATNTMAKCGGLLGHCDLDRDVVDASCRDGEWETFIITAVDGVSGNVCYGDRIRLQYSPDKTKYLSSGDGGYTLLTDANNRNNILEILPVTGSIYLDPRAELDRKNDERDDEICENNPFDPNCLFNIPDYLIYTAIGVVALIVIIILIVILK